MRNTAPPYDPISHASLGDAVFGQAAWFSELMSPDTQPRIRAYDMGGNMLSTDSGSGVLMSILVNPASATLLPEDRVFEVSIQGSACNKP